MEKFKEIKTTTIVNEDFTTSTSSKTLLHTIRHWNELNEDEKNEEIKTRQQAIYETYQEELYYNYKDELDYIREDFKNITFDDIYLDSNSHGGWVDSIKGFKYNCEGIEVYGEYIEVYDIGLSISRYIQEIDEDNIDLVANGCDYYLDEHKFERIKATKKFQKWLNQIIDDVNNWVDRVNDACKHLIKEEYNCPSLLSIEWEREWLDNYFEEEEFETIEEIKEN